VDTNQKIPPLEFQSLRFCFEEMMRKPPYNFGDFTQREDGGYRVYSLQLAWHTLRCGYLAGKAFRESK
jgi:hypothetical protein